MNRLPIKTRQRVDYEISPLKKAEACAALVVAFGEDDARKTEAATLNLQEMMGSQWMWLHALQFLAGRAGLTAIESALEAPVRENLMFARQVALSALAAIQNERKGRSP